MSSPGSLFGPPSYALLSEGYAEAIKARDHLRAEVERLTRELAEAERKAAGAIEEAAKVAELDVKATEEQQRYSVSYYIETCVACRIARAIRALAAAPEAEERG